MVVGFQEVLSCPSIQVYLLGFSALVEVIFEIGKSQGNFVPSFSVNDRFEGL